MRNKNRTFGAPQAAHEDDFNDRYGCSDSGEEEANYYESMEPPMLQNEDDHGTTFD